MSNPQPPHHPRRSAKKTLRAHRSNGQAPVRGEALYLTHAEARHGHALIEQIRHMSSPHQIDPMIQRINDSPLSPAIKDHLMRGLMHRVRNWRG